ncbi:peptidylprolyl isomerase [Candidatus Peregrinibacteria bacterium]|nr:peptidylprolyl isomerase [Candidatus Peregrinibacteria bacterium]
MEEPTVTTPQLTEAAQAQLAAPQAGDKIAVIETEKGTIKFKLFTDQVPEISKNFEELANAGNYNGTPFHRVMQDFMIQTGDFTNKNGTGGYSYKGEGTILPDEIVPELKHLYGTVSMANRGPNTNGSQFFIVTNENGTAFLDGSYTIFGQVFEGMDVAEAIEALEIPGTERPSETVTMTDVKVMEYQPE